MENFKYILEKYTEINVEADFSTLPDDIIKALPHLKNAMDVITDIFIMQQNEKLPAHFKEVMASGDNLTKKYYSFFKGPYNEFDNFKSPFKDIEDRRKGCAFYPESLTDSQILEQIKSLGNDEKIKAEDHFSVIREKEGKLISIPYHIYYRDYLEKASAELVKASEIINHENLKKFLITRAETLLDGDYRRCDTEWVKLTDSPIDLLLGPYEVYADSLLGIKATYESMLMIVDREKCAALKEIEDNLDNLSALFPLPDSSKSAVSGTAPIVVVNQIYAAGEAASGVMPAAFNLPNDSWVRGNTGWKQVMLYNVMSAKFNTATVEIAERVLEDSSKAQFDPLFTFVLLHEISHGLGPAYRKDGSEVSKSLGSYYPALEETKADTGSLFLILKAGGRYGIKKYDEEILLSSYLAGIFRSVRFGIHEAHGLSNIMQLNWFIEKGNISYSSSRYHISSKDILKNTDKLLTEICSLEASGSKEDAYNFIKKYGNPDENLLKTLNSLKDIPVDIRAVFPDPQ